MDISYEFRIAAQRLEFAFRNMENSHHGQYELRAVIDKLRREGDEAFLRAYNHRRPGTPQKITQPDINEWRHELRGQIQLRLDALSQLGVRYSWS